MNISDDGCVVNRAREEELPTSRPGEIINIIEVRSDHLVHHPVLLIAVLVIEQSATIRVPRLELPHDDDALIVSGGQELAIR